ncbi:hypothetical protein COV93_07045 [Candidatus Woesearchaeota archaeon CG11_big_fil_rev_8_21_14_0_20_43_8]|nr:MAG: hypothetical protein COV93_07045 [Candidatus Woesearchaeota archaeon CG11_big_fil_rev_8_21_14_0_20_43_8]PIO04947.1 MAG: hypothetical protein COT47_06880 [Candidatus Woesearchaeota archaeon CG08_land_8_20_14_0_20_43_7]
MISNISQQDLHIHTRFSLCGIMESQPDLYYPWELSEFKKKIPVLGVSDHFHFWTDRKDFEGEIAEIKRHDPDILLGVEVDFCKAIEDIILPKDLWSKFDYILGSPHNVSTTFVRHPARPEQYLDVVKTVGLKKFISLNVQDHISLCELPHITGIAHPLIVPVHLGLVDKIPHDDIAYILQTARDTGTCIELHRPTIERLKKAGNMEFIDNLVRTGIEIGTRFTFGSDAHNKADIGMPAWIEEYLLGLGLGPEHLFIPRKK